MYGPYRESLDLRISLLGAATGQLERTETIDRTESFSLPAREALRKALKDLDRVMGALGEIV